MLKFLYSNIKKGIEKIGSNSQLVYTCIVAIVIITSFVLVSEQFVGIANDAQERLINVRIGSLQDAFVSFAGEKINEPEYLNKKINEIIKNNETIKNFKIVSNKADNYFIVASNDMTEVGQIDSNNSFIYGLASSDVSNSVTIAESERNQERLFKTARAIIDESENIIGIVSTTQTLSLADIAIQKSITNSRIILFIVIVIIMLLFLRLSKVVDYIDLYKRLKEIDQLKDDFVSMASHELRTPLSIICGYAEFIKEAPELSPQTKDFTLKIDASTKELSALISDILDVSRIEQGRFSFKLEKINPSDLIERVTNNFSLQAKEKSLLISFDKSAVNENQNINVDQEKLIQILVNLIGNAVKYTNKGEIKIKQYSEKKTLYIRISDTGIGMSEEEREKLFEKFYRIRTEDTKDIRGTGLGLWIVNQIVRDMKGKISVESIKGVGSHFIVSFPLV